MHHSGVKIEEEIIDIAMPANSLCMSEDGINELVPSWKVVYLVCSLCNIDFRVLTEEQALEHGEALVGSVDFVLVD